MRWVLRLLAAASLIWIGFMASPYVAFYRLARAVEDGDARAVGKRLNLRAIRMSLARQIAVAAVEAASTRRDLGQADRQLAADAATVLVEPLVARLATPEGVMDLLTRRPSLASDAGAEPARASMGRWNLAAVWRLYAASETRGFRSIFVSFPPERPVPERFRVRLRLQRFTWRITDVDLPAALRGRLVESLARDRGAAGLGADGLKATLPPGPDEAKP